MRRAGPSGAVFAAVAAGGFAGTLLRYGLGLGLPETAHFPATTLAINVAGSLVLGFLTGRWSRMLKVPDWLRAGIGPGLLGSFTTFSALSVAVASSWGPGRGGALALFGYLVASLALGFASAALGHRYGAGRRGATHRGGRDGARDGGRRGSSAPPQAAP